MSGMKVPENAVVYFPSRSTGSNSAARWFPGDQLRFEVETVQVRG